jgi:hypothetical protein
MKKNHKWLVKVPVTIMVCVEVESHNRGSAIIAANETVEGLQPVYIDDNSRIERLQTLFNSQANLDRPLLVGLGVSGKPGVVWFDTTSFDQCDLFLSSKTQVLPLE